MRSKAKFGICAVLITSALCLTGCADAAKKIADKAADASLSPSDRALYDKCIDALNKATNASIEGLNKLGKGEELSDETSKSYFGDDQTAKDCEKLFNDHPEQALRATVEYAEKNKGKIEAASKDAQDQLDKLQKQYQQELDQLSNTTLPQ